jgi:hypothetical protein
MGAFLRLVWLVLKSSKREPLMPYGKTLELGFLGLRGKHQDRFYLRDGMKIIYNGQ